MNLLDGAAQAAYWTGRLSSDLESVIEDGCPHTVEVARLTLIEFKEWRDGLTEGSTLTEASVCAGCGHDLHAPGDCTTFFPPHPSPHVPSKCMCGRDNEAR